MHFKVFLKKGTSSHIITKQRKHLISDLTKNNKIKPTLFINQKFNSQNILYNIKKNSINIKNPNITD